MFCSVPHPITRARGKCGMKAIQYMGVGIPAVVSVAGATDRIRVDLTGRARSLKVTSEAEIGVAGDQHLLVDRAVRTVAGDAAFFHRAVFKDERTLLRGMAFGAGFILAFHRCAHAFNGVPGVDIMAIDAGNPARQYRVGIRQTEFSAFLEVAGKTGFR